jgi:hypothetical protein
MMVGFPPHVNPHRRRGGEPLARLRREPPKSPCPLPQSPKKREGFPLPYIYSLPHFLIYFYLVQKKGLKKNSYCYIIKKKREDNVMEKKSNKNGIVTLIVVIFAIIGVVCAALFVVKALKKRKEEKEDSFDDLDDLDDLDEAEDLGEKLEEKAEEIKEEIKEAVEE